MRLTTTHIMYGILWAMLIVQITMMMNTSAYSILTQTVSEETGRIIADNGTIVSKYAQFIAGISDRKHTQPAYSRMLNVRRHVAAEQYALDSIIHLIAAETGYTASQMPQYPENRKWQKVVFPEKAAVFRLLSGIDTLNEFLIRNVNPRQPDSRAYLRRHLPSKWGDKGWEEQESYRAETAAMLYKSNAAAAVAILTAFKQNIVLSEKMILEELYREGMPHIDVFETIIVVAVPNKNFVVPGDAISGNIYLAAYNRHFPLHVSCTEGKIADVTNGIATWKGMAKRIGQHRVSGNITIRKDTITRNIPWEVYYRIGTPYASIQLDKMSCIYRDIQNPLTIQCAANYDIRDMSLYIPGAEVSTTATGGKYLIRVKSRAVRKLTAMIIYKKRDGSADTIGGLILKVKDLPLPVATIGAQIRHNITVEDFLREGGLSAVCPDEDLAITYKVKSYAFSVFKKGDSDISGPVITTGSDYTHNEALAVLMKQISKGDRIFFDAIQAEAPDGSLVNIAPVCYLLE